MPLSPSERSMAYADRQWKARRCIRCIERNPRWPKKLCSSCANKAADYYKRIGKEKRDSKPRPTIRLLKFMASKIKTLERELRNASNS